jgi:bifunctional enzyme CysN/CysC
VSALLGDNCVHASKKMPWYDQGTLLEYLENVPVTRDYNLTDFRFAVQYVLRPNLNYRGFSGTVSSGTVRKGDTVMALPSGRQSKVRAIDTYDGELDSAHPPMSVTLRLEDEIDLSRGDMLVAQDGQIDQDQRLHAMLVWMNEKPLDRSQSYLLKHTTQLVRADVEIVDFIVDLETLEHKPANRLELNDIAGVTISCHKKLFYDTYRKNRATGAFILIDPISNTTVAAGMIDGGAAALSERSKAKKAQVARPKSLIGVDERSERLKQKGATVWLTGLPCSGKTEIAFELERQLFDRRCFAMVVDPDDGLSQGVRTDGSSPAQTPEFARRCTDAGLFTIFSYASPLRADRAALADAVRRERFVEVHVATSIESCRKRDKRGAYGPSHPDPDYEKPHHPDIVVSLDSLDAAEAAHKILELLIERGLLPSRYSL